MGGATGGRLSKQRDKTGAELHREMSSATQEKQGPSSNSNKVCEWKKQNVTAKTRM